MRFGSLFSGIEAATVAWQPLGWKTAFTAEIERFPRRVLEYRLPNVPNLGDVTANDFIERARDLGAIDVLIGGSPCQSFSVAGRRAGLDDARGQLAFVFLQIARGLRPRWLVFENVPGLLSSNGGKDFGAILWALGQCGYGFSYRVLDAQWFGVPQRRRRVFIVGYFGDWRRAAAVLFERESLSGNIAPSREAREEIAGTLKSCSGKSGGFSNSADHAAGGYMQVAPCITQNYGKQPDNSDTGAGPMLVADTLRVGANSLSGFPGDVVAPPLMSGSSFAAGHNARGGHCKDAHIVAMSLNAHGQRIDGESETFIASDYESGEFAQSDISRGITTSADRTRAAAIAANAQLVRRLTPRECERLQGFPDDWTRIPIGKGWAKDGPRYKALGNSMAVPVIRYIGERIQEVDAL